MTLDFSTVTALKKAVFEQFGTELHFHDSCGGGTYLSIDEPNAQINSYLQDYCKKNHKILRISANGKNFEIES